MKWYWVFLFLALYKLISNAVKLFKCINLQANYIEFLEGDPDMSIYQDSNDVKRLIIDAGVVNKIIPVVEPAGCGIIHTMNPSVLSQYPSRDGRFARAALIMFEEAIGEYKHRCLETFNPLYWIDAIIWLPKRFLCYLGITDTNIAAKAFHSLFQGLYWLAGTAFITYNDEAKIVLLAIIERMKAALLG